RHRSVSFEVRQEGTSGGGGLSNRGSSAVCRGVRPFYSKFPKGLRLAGRRLSSRRTIPGHAALNQAALTQGASMLDLARAQRRDRIVSCPRCGTPMDEVVTIAPSLGEPGLIGYECPNCVFVTSELVQPASNNAYLFKRTPS